MKTDTRARLLANSMGVSNGAFESVQKRQKAAKQEEPDSSRVPLAFGASAFAFRNRGLAEMFQRSQRCPFVL